MQAESYISKNYIYIYCRSAEALEDNVDAVNTLPGLGGEDQLYLSCQIRP